MNKDLKCSEPCQTSFDQAELQINAFVRTLPLEKIAPVLKALKQNPATQNTAILMHVLQGLNVSDDRAQLDYSMEAN